MHMLLVQKILHLPPTPIQQQEPASSPPQWLDTTTSASMQGSRTAATPTMSPSQRGPNNMRLHLVMQTPEIGDPPEPASFM